MKNTILVFLFAFTALAQSCGNAVSDSTTCMPEKVLTAAKFAETIKNCPDITIVDVRTAGEFASGHIDKALHIDISNRNFTTEIVQLDKTKPVLVYCLSGARSASAVNFMRSNGFKTVSDMQGGLMQWRAAKLPLVQGANAAAPVAGTDMEKLLKTDKLVLIDFYAEWCQPCKKMAPYLEEINKEMGQNVQVVRIDADKEQALTQNLGVTALPTLMLYKQGKMIWRHEGYIEKKDVVERLNKG